MVRHGDQEHAVNPTTCYRNDAWNAWRVCVLNGIEQQLADHKAERDRFARLHLDLVISRTAQIEFRSHLADLVAEFAQGQCDSNHARALAYL